MKTLLVIACLLVSSAAQAQTYTTASVMKWDAPSNAMDAADAQSFTWRAYVNGATAGVVVAGVTCGAPEPAQPVVACGSTAAHSTFTCSATMPAAIVPGMNRRRSSLVITSEDTATPVSGESGPTNSCVTNRRPNASTNLRNQAQ